MAQVILYNQLGYRPLIWRTISCYLLARWIEEHGYTCQVIEFTHLFTPEELYDYTKMFIGEDTVCIGASSSMWSTYSSELMMNIHAKSVPDNIHHSLSEIKKEFPKIKTVVGGHRFYNSLQGIDIFDYKCVIDFGEDWFLKLLDEITDKPLGKKLTRKQFDISSHKFIFREHDCILPNETLPMEWGRGCIFKCPFCRSPNLGKKSGSDEKNVSLMTDILSEMYEKFGTTSYYFVDETFNADVNRIENLYAVSKKLPFQLEYIVYARADLIDKHPHTIDMLQESGLRGVLFGIETFDPEASKLVLKPWSAKRGKDFLLNLRERWDKVHIDCSLIAGLPGVSREYHFELAEWFEKSKMGFFNFKPLLMVRDADSTKSTWEIDSSKLKITWPIEKEPAYWEWGNTNYLNSYKLASELNRHFKVQDRPFAWSLGAFRAFGFKLEQLVNLKTKDIIELCGDLYENETLLFEKYKKMLLSIAGR
jgi:radical SAM superfamily enzyme YgiQ (UPF0313 family)